jgi:hypothetical protein
MIMIETSSAMPTAVITESSEKTISMTMICAIVLQSERTRAFAAASSCSAPSSL